MVPPPSHRPCLPGRLLLSTCLLLSGLPTGAGAQLATADPGAAGTGAPSPALVRGYGAVAVNPAALGAEDGPSFSVTVLSLGLWSGLDPVGLDDLAAWEGREVPRGVRLRWLDEVVGRGSEAGSAGLDVTLAAASRGPFGFQLSTRAYGTMALNPDAAELLLFGNAGLDGSPRDFDLRGSRGEGWVVTSAGIGYGRAVGRVRGGRLHLGVTATVSVAHALVLGRDNGSGLTGDPTELDLRFPVMYVAGAAGGLDHGRGAGLHLGALWIEGNLALGATIRNLIHHFGWARQDLAFRPGAALFDVDESSTDFEERPAEEAPPVLLDALDALSFRRGLSLGAAYRTRPDLTLTADVRLEEQGGLSVEPDLQVGVGGEYRVREDVPLRAGFAVVQRGIQLAGGAGVELGRFILAGTAAVRVGALDDVVLGTVGASFRAR